MTPGYLRVVRVKDEEKETMPQFSTFSREVNTLRKYRSPMIAYRDRMPRLSVFAISVLTFALIPAATVSGQGVSEPPALNSASQPGGGVSSPLATTLFTDSQNPGDDRGSSGNSSSSQVPSTLSPDQIIQILQQNPDLVVELKSQVADHLQQQGTQIDANDISDEMLYNQIATNTDVRGSISTFLWAHGYQSSVGLPVTNSNTGAGSANSDLLTGEQSPTDMYSGRLAADGSKDVGLSATSRSALTTNMRQATNSATSRQEDRREREEVNSSTDLPKVLRQPAPYNLQSMRDLYTQIPDGNVTLKRFGSEVFVNRSVSAMALGGSGRDTPLDVPLGPDYVLGAGDTLKINMWGGMTQIITRVIDRDGSILLPDAGSLDVGGLPLSKAESLIGGALARQYRDVHFSVTVSQLRSVRVYIVGDVQRPGGYDISSLATPLSALYAAGGPTSVGSLRIARHYRGDQLIEEVDLYDFLLHGIRTKSARFESGDTLLVPAAGTQVAVSGAVKRPAIYEIKPGDATLASVVADAGGFTAAASLSHIAIERIGINGQRETVTLKIASAESSPDSRTAIAGFQVKDGDRIQVAQILPYSQSVIYLAGHVARPGRLPYTEGMRLSDVLHSYKDMLPEPGPHGQIVRLVPPDLHAEAIQFDVPDVLIGNANLPLQPFDTIRIFGRYEVDAPKVTVQGEVLQPSTYPLSKGMTAAQLVRLAGGFKRDALLESADLTSYGVLNENRIVGSLATVRIGAAVAGTDSGADVPLKPGDVLTIHQITGWNEIGESVTIDGQVKFPGTYGFQEGERLSSVLRRAGGFRETAYPAGALLVRAQVRELEEKSREELIRQIETSSAAARLSPNLGSTDSGQALKVIQEQQDQVLSQLKSQPASGRQVVHISADIASWANTPADIELRRGDVLTIPKRPSFVLVTGQVYNVTALTFTPGKTAGWYLQHAGGTSDAANRKEIIVIRANGSVIGRHSGGLFDPAVLSTKLDPGDVVVVPQKVIGASVFWRNLLTTAQLASSIAITAAVATL
jgi:protein involved in polysaccharide export with SLBB domain